MGFNGFWRVWTGFEKPDAEFSSALPDIPEMEVLSWLTSLTQFFKFKLIITSFERFESVFTNFSEFERIQPKNFENSKLLTTSWVHGILMVILDSRNASRVILLRANATGSGSQASVTRHSWKKIKTSWDKSYTGFNRFWLVLIWFGKLWQVLTNFDKF